jgi:hypothetical protein
MKKSRRQELKTNELSEQLKAAYQWMNQHSNYLAGGLIVIAMVMVIGWVVHGRQLRAEQAAWNRYNDLRQAESVTQLDIDQADELIQEFQNDAELGPVVMGLKADLLYEWALDLNPHEEQEQRVELLTQARKVSQQLIERFSDRPTVMAEARMRLAAVEESLYLTDAGDKEKIRKLYEKLMENKAGPYQALAKELLSTLDDRLAELELATTQPAEAVTTQPVATTQPAVTTQPAGSAQPKIKLVPTQ